MKINLAAMIKLVADPGDKASPPTGEFHDELHRVMIGAPPGAPPGTSPNKIDQGANPKKPNAEGNKPDLGSKESEEGSQDTDDDTKSANNGLASQILAVIQLLPAISPLPNSLPTLSLVSTPGEDDLAPGSDSNPILGINAGTDAIPTSPTGVVPSKIVGAQLDLGMVNSLPIDSKTFGSVTGLDLGMIPAPGMLQPSGPSFGAPDRSVQDPIDTNPIANQLTVQADGSGTLVRNAADAQSFDADLITTLNPTNLTVEMDPHSRPAFFLASAPVIVNPDLESLAHASISQNSVISLSTTSQVDLNSSAQEMKLESSPIVVGSAPPEGDSIGLSPKTDVIEFPKTSVVNSVGDTNELPNVTPLNAVPKVESNLGLDGASTLVDSAPTGLDDTKRAEALATQPLRISDAPTLGPTFTGSDNELVTTSTPINAPSPTPVTPTGTLEHQPVTPTSAPTSDAKAIDVPVTERIDASGSANLTTISNPRSLDVATNFTSAKAESESTMIEEGGVGVAPVENRDKADSDSKVKTDDAATLNVSETRTPLTASKETSRDPLTPQDMGTVMRQVIDRLETLSAQQMPHRLTIRLEPEHFGTITISFRGIGAQTHATVTSDNRAVLDALQANKPEFLSVSSNLGLSLNDFSFSSSNGGSMPGQNDNPVDFNRNVQLNQALQPAEDSTTYVAAPLSTDHLDMRI